MIDLLKELSVLCGISGREENVRKYILNQISPYADCKVDALGNIIAQKKGLKHPDHTLMMSAHMDEVGLIIHSIDENGYLYFSPVGGIDPRVLLGRSVSVGEKAVYGVIGSKPIHMLDSNERKQAPGFLNLYIDIGANNKEEAEKLVSLGDFACFDSEFIRFGDGFIKGKALDDRVGCAILINLIKKSLPYDITFVFTVQEEVGTRGAGTAAFAVDPDYAIVIEATTAADISGVKPEQEVCVLGKGAVISFMDGRTIYDRDLYHLAFATSEETNIPCQTKAGISGGNDAGAIHRSRNGVRTIAVSLPCRYLHSPSCVIHEKDLIHTADFVEALSKKILENGVIH